MKSIVLKSIYPLGLIIAMVGMYLWGTEDRRVLPAPITIESAGYPPTDKASHVVVDSDGSYGSGVIIDCQPAGEGLWTVVVLTAAHALSGNPVQLSDNLIGYEAPPLFVIGDNYKLPVSRAIASPAVDLGMLKFTSPRKIPIVRLAAQHPDDGGWVWTVGYPGDPTSYTIAVGSMTSGKLISAPIFYGSSGGAVLNRQGEIVGIVIKVRLDEGGRAVSTAGIVATLTDIKGFLAPFAASRPSSTK
jgi:S1-C subfamily serine protease